MPLPLIEPCLVNSANPWATTTQDLQALFDCPFTGAITTRTSLINGFAHDETLHQYIFFDTDRHVPSNTNLDDKSTSSSRSFKGSLNTLGYSPIPLATYLSMIHRVIADSSLPDDVRRRKPIILSITGSAETVVQCYRKISETQLGLSNPLCMEINLSCPNIQGKPPPAYSRPLISQYLSAMSLESSAPTGRRVSVGIKTPPYTYYEQFKTLIDAILAVSTDTCPIDFITATNTLGSSLVLADPNGAPALSSASGMDIGGMAGAPLHPLALGNVKTIRAMLNAHDKLRQIDVIGVGGVSDRDGFRRMQAVGAKIVGVGTALGTDGVEIFKEILE